MSFWIVPVSAVRGRALLVGDGDVEREQPRGGGVDRHRRVHLVERNAGEQRAHVAQMRDRHADLADLAARQLVVGVVAGLGRQIEGDGQAGLALGEVLAVELVGLRRRRVAGSRCGTARACRAPARLPPQGAAWAGSWHRSSVRNREMGQRSRYWRRAQAEALARGSLTCDQARRLRPPARHARRGSSDPAA